MRNGLLCAAGIFFSSILYADSNDNAKDFQLKQCLLEDYRVDLIVLPQILEKFSPLLENDTYSPILDEFLEESKKLNIYSELSEPSENTSPTFHLVLFENSHLRVSWAVTKSGEQEPFQKHPWKTLMVIIRSSQFHSQREDGSNYEDDWPIGTYLLEPSSDLLSCKNIGSEEYNGLIFEIKTSASN